MKKIAKGLVIILVIGFAFFSWNWFSAKRSLADYVQKIQPGMQLAEAQAYAKQKGLKYKSFSRRNEAGLFTDYVMPDGVMGRFLCEIQHDGTVVVKVDRQFND